MLSEMICKKYQIQIVINGLDINVYDNRRQGRREKGHVETGLGTPTGRAFVHIVIREALENLPIRVGAVHFEVTIPRVNEDD